MGTAERRFFGWEKNLVTYFTSSIVVVGLCGGGDGPSCLHGVRRGRHRRGHLHCYG